MYKSQNKFVILFSRYGRITASNIHEMAYCKTPDGFLVRKIIGATKVQDTYAMERGRLLEKEVIKQLSKNLNLKMWNSGALLDTKNPILIGSPDSVGNDFVVEIKCPTRKETVCNYINKKNQVNSKRYSQIQLQMYLKKCALRYFCVASPNFENDNKITCIEICYNEEYVKRLIDNAMLFWKKNIFILLLQSAANSLF